MATAQPRELGEVGELGKLPLLVPPHSHSEDSAKQGDGQRGWATVKQEVMLAKGGGDARGSSQRPTGGREEAYQT